MARYKVAYTAYPNSPEATEYSRSRAEISFRFSVIVVLATLGAAGYFIHSAYMLFSGGKSADLLYALLCLSAVAAVDLYFYVFRGWITDRECQIILANSQRETLDHAFIDRYIQALKTATGAAMKRFAKRYCLFFLGGTACAAGITGTVCGIYQLCHRQQGLDLLICSAVGTCACAVCTWRVFKKMNATRGAGDTQPAAVHHIAKAPNRPGIRTHEIETAPKQEVSPAYRKAARVLCYTGLAVFLVLFWMIAPGSGVTKIFYYLVGAAAAVFLAALFYTRDQEDAPKGLYRFAALLAALVLAASGGLWITYEAKVDAVLAAIPASGEVYMRINTDEEYHPLPGSGSIQYPPSYVRIGDELYQDGDTANIKPYGHDPIRVGFHSGSGGYREAAIAFPPDMPQNPYAVRKEIYIGSDLYAEVTVTFTRVTDFWEVVLYRKP